MPYKHPEERREYHRRYSRKHYQENKSEYKKRSAARKNRIRQEIRETINLYLSQHPCIDCGEADIRVLEFDHRDNEIKTFSIAEAQRIEKRGMALMAEILKCDVRCANCHRKRTWESGVWGNGKRAP